MVIKNIIITYSSCMIKITIHIQNQYKTRNNVLMFNNTTKYCQKQLMKQFDNSKDIKSRLQKDPILNPFSSPTIFHTTDIDAINQYEESPYELQKIDEKRQRLRQRLPNNSDLNKLFDEIQNAFGESLDKSIPSESESLQSQYSGMSKKQFHFSTLHGKCFEIENKLPTKSNKPTLYHVIQNKQQELINDTHSFQKMRINLSKENSKFPTDKWKLERMFLSEIEKKKPSTSQPKQRRVNKSLEKQEKPKILTQAILGKAVRTPTILQEVSKAPSRGEKVRSGMELRHSNFNINPDRKVIY